MSLGQVTWPLPTALALEVEMDDRDEVEGGGAGGSFWRSRAGVALLVFLAVSALLLVYEHRVHLLTSNGILAMLLLLCVGIHLFLHNWPGGHDGHGRGSGRDHRVDDGAAK